MSESEVQKAIATTLRALRAEAHITQKEVASALEVPQPVVSQLENGTRRLRADEVITYTDAVGSTPAEFYSRVETIRSKTKEKKR